jgi:hypothetical protein
MKVIFCLPGNYYSGTFVSCWTSLLEQCRQRGIEIILQQSYSSLVHYARNNCLEGNVLLGVDQKPFQGVKDYDYIMWIDSDIVFTPNDFFSLLSLNKDVSSGLYRMKDGTCFATKEKTIPDNYSIQNIGYIEETDQKFSFLTDETLAGRKDIFKVDYTGMGWMLIKKGVVESLRYPWFYSTVKNYQIGTRFIADFISEDVQFCENVRRVGYDIWINPNIIVGHEKTRII